MPLVLPVSDSFPVLKSFWFKSTKWIIPRYEWGVGGGGGYGQLEKERRPEQGSKFF